MQKLLAQFRYFLNLHPFGVDCDQTKTELEGDFPVFGNSGDRNEFTAGEFCEWNCGNGPTAPKTVPVNSKQNDEVFRGAHDLRTR